jgi:phage baseplate assembly protein W
VDIKVVTRDAATGVLSIGIPRPPQFVSGIDLLVQVVVIELMTSPGRDIIDPASGGNIRSLIGANVAFDDEGEIFAEVKMMVSTAEANIKRKQASVARPANEKLGRLELVDLVPDEVNAQLEVILRVVSLDQQDTEAIVGLQ